MPTELTPTEWDEQFSRQAGWTRPVRAHLYRRANLLRAERVLDVGSGTGAVTEELAARTQGQVVGVDIDPAMVAYARQRGGRAEYRLGDAHDLPFGNAGFDVTACHFTLMWCRDPAQAAAEMVRVTRPGGAVLICAEPDYGGRIDHPNLPLGRWQVEALRREGADPCLGRKLRGLFALPGVRRTDAGVIPGLWDLAKLRIEFEAEWALWERSLAGIAPPEELARVKAADLTAIESGERLAFLPVFYAMVRL
ncbi:MAG: methyltransferase domain-containing protein [Anaerolineae bacterium]|jgi:SAM-dependent methyltransferase